MTNRRPEWHATLALVIVALALPVLAGCCAPAWAQGGGHADAGNAGPAGEGPATITAPEGANEGDNDGEGTLERGTEWRKRSGSGSRRRC